MSAQSNLFDSSDSKSNTAAAAQYPSAVDEEHLVSAARSGDSNAFVELYDRHSKKLLARIYRITRNWEDAEDALQDAAVRAFVHVASFEGRSNFASWLTRIATNSAFMVLRKRRASAEVSIEQSFEQSENRVMREPPDYAESPEAYSARRESERLLRQAIQRLPRIFRETIEVQQAQDCSTGRVAAELGISESAAKSRLMRARNVLRRRLSGARTRTAGTSKSVTQNRSFSTDDPTLAF